MQEKCVFKKYQLQKTYVWTVSHESLCEEKIIQLKISAMRKVHISTVSYEFF